jgi:hypothetical protein
MPRSMEQRYAQMARQLLITAKAVQEGGVQVALFNSSQGGSYVF